MTEKYTPPKIWAPKQQGGRFGGVNQPTAGARHEQILPLGDKPLQLYSLNTPNGIKVNILLKELATLGIEGAAFDAYKIDIMALDQFGSDFVAINPNSKIPALLDQSGDEAINVFESGAILQYLAEKFEQFIPLEQGQARAECQSWLMWQMGSAPYLGGGFGHFYRYAPEPMEYPLDRFTMEAKRQLDVLNQHLATSEYICEYGYSIADMAIFPWYGRLAIGEQYGDANVFLQTHEYTHLVRWAEQIAARDAIKQAVDMPLADIA